MYSVPSLSNAAWASDNIFSVFLPFVKTTIIDHHTRISMFSLVAAVVDVGSFMGYGWGYVVEIVVKLCVVKI